MGQARRQSGLGLGAGNCLPDKTPGRLRGKSPGLKADEEAHL